MQIPEEWKEVGVKIIGAFGCAVVMILPVAALFTACCVVVVRSAKEVQREAADATAQVLGEALKQAAALEQITTEARTLILVRSIGAGAAVPGPSAVFAVGSIDSFERSVREVAGKSDPGDPEFVEKVLSAFSVLALFEGEPAALPPPHEKK